MSPRLPIISMLIACHAVVGGGSPSARAAEVATRPAGFHFSAQAVVEASYDSNVMLQSVTDQAGIGSWVSSVSAPLALEWQGDRAHNASLSYTPTWVRFHSQGSENHVAHRLGMSLSGRGDGLSYGGTLSLAVVDGSDESPVWTGTGGAPATGGATVRDRRDQAVGRGGARVEWRRGGWFARGVAAAYVADFQTRIEPTPGCQNNVDRDDLSAGIDLGRTPFPGVDIALGYRRGHQDQARLLTYPEQYDNDYDRLLALVEGTPFRWLKVALVAGPEFRRYGPRVHATFRDRSVTNAFVDAVATITLTRRDAITLLGRQFEQLSSSGRGAFEDLNLDLAWRHTFSPHATAGITLHTYNTDFLRPAVRNDWLLTARVHGSFAISRAWSVDASWLAERGDSVVAHMPGREYTRRIAALSVRAKL